MQKKRLMKIVKYINRVGTLQDPVSIQAGITDFCFNQCHMCSHHLRDDKTELPVAEWIKFLSGLENLESVCYSGGDPMAMKNFNDIMTYHISSGKAFGAITAGFFPNHIDLGLLSAARWVRVSLDTIDPNIYDECRGLMRVESVLESIHEAKQNGVNIELTITVSKKSAPHLPQLFDYAIKNKFNADIHPVYGESFGSICSYHMISDYHYKFKEHGLVLAPYIFNDSQSVNCYAPYYQIFVDSKGDIYPCCVLAGDTKNNESHSKLGNISNWPDFLRNRISFSDKPISEPACENCIARFSEINSVVENNYEMLNKNNFF